MIEITYWALLCAGCFPDVTSFISPASPCRYHQPPPLCSACWKANSCLSKFYSPHNSQEGSFKIESDHIAPPLKTTWLSVSRPENGSLCSGRFWRTCPLCHITIFCHSLPLFRPFWSLYCSSILPGELSSPHLSHLGVFALGLPSAWNPPPDFPMVCTLFPQVVSKVPT